MGLDISAHLDNEEELFELDEYRAISKQSNLSRTFCNFMCRREVVVDCNPELDQLGKMTGVDISFLYDMANYTPEWEINEILEFERDEEEKEKQKQALLLENAKIENNIKLVEAGLSQLINELKLIFNLEEKLEQTNFDTLGIKEYFSSFNDNPGDGYIGNNLGQDLRNLLILVEFGLNRGSKTVYFHFG